MSTRPAKGLQAPRVGPRVGPPRVEARAGSGRPVAPRDHGRWLPGRRTPARGDGGSGHPVPYPCRRSRTRPLGPAAVSVALASRGAGARDGHSGLPAPRRSRRPPARGPSQRGGRRGPGVTARCSESARAAVALHDLRPSPRPRRRSARLAPPGQARGPLLMEETP